MLRYPIALALLAFSVAAPAQQAPVPPSVPAATAEQAARQPLTEAEAAMRAHVMFLASDAMLGRDAGSTTYTIAAEYVAARFSAHGLQPAGDNGGYLQRVPLVSYKLADHGEFSFAHDGAAAVPLVFGEDYVPAANPAVDVTRVSAPLVFVGYGIDAPSEGRDDYAGVDVRGKIVVFLSGSPENLHSELRASLGGSATKAEMAARRGAVGAIAIENPGTRSPGIAMLASAWDRARTTWGNPDGTGHVNGATAPLLGTISRAAAARLFEGAATPWADIQAAVQADVNATFTAMALPTTLSAQYTTAREGYTSYNVAGLLPGRDPQLAHEVVVLSAHLDHVGVGRPDQRGDTIYNGAMDNAVGIASLIEEARRFQQSGERPRRSILFLAVTAEEKGLVGSDYFAENYRAADMPLVADVNLDMPILTYHFEDVIAFGADRSTLGPIVRSAAARAGVGFSPDPMPEQSLFVRSDHYRFVQQGIPSVFLWPGEAGPGKEATEAFFRDHYHQPSDEVGQTPAIDWASGVRFIDVNYQIAREIADADHRPVWNRGDFFGTYYHGPMAQ